jgi:hypothetical protein
MKRLTVLTLAVALLLGIVGFAAAADETTLTGKIMCAKCVLKKADAKECQDVLVVKNDKGEAKEYYIAKNAVSEKFGHTCTGEKPAVVTGTVSDKDGKTWIDPTKMTPSGGTKG